MSSGCFQQWELIFILPLGFRLQIQQITYNSLAMVKVNIYMRDIIYLDYFVLIPHWTLL